MKRLLSISAVSIICVGFAAPRAAAQTTSAFMQTTPEIRGDSVDDRHPNWIGVISLSQSWPGASTKKSSCQVGVLKSLDSAGPQLWGAAVTGQLFSEIHVDVLRAGRDQQRIYELVLFNAVIASISTDPVQLGENLLIVPQSAKLTFYPQKQDGSLGNPVTSTVACQ